MDISSLSDRGQQLASNPARVDFEVFMDAMQNLYSKEENPNGAFPLNVAENKLMSDVIRNKLNSIMWLNEIPEWVMAYTHPNGHPEVRQQVAQFMETHLCKCPIDENSIAFSAGASAIIEACSFVLSNPGDVVVIPAPSYPMYTNDLGVKSGMERFDLQTHFEITEINSALITEKLLDQTKSDLDAQGKCFKLLLISSPDNPTGISYPMSHLEIVAQWCSKNKIHLVVNEIYGLSTIDTKHPAVKDDYDHNLEFGSFAQIMKKHQSDYLHLWYAMSKDFASSGLRFGILHSLNEALIEGFSNANIPHMVSNHTQWMIGNLLSDNVFLKDYLPENQRSLTKSYVLTINILKELGIEYVPIRGSFFVWADFSKYLTEQTQEAEDRLWLEIYENTGIVLTPGKGFQHQKKGLFRIVFTAVPFDLLQVALERMKNYLHQRRQAE